MIPGTIITRAGRRVYLRRSETTGGGLLADGRWWLGLLGLLAAVLIAGCGGAAGTLEPIYTQAAGNRVGAAVALRQGYFAKSFTPAAVVDMALARMESPGDNNAMQFAGAVLDFLDQVEPDLSGQPGVDDAFWKKVGQLACRATDKAFTLDDMPQAKTLALAGTTHWQTEEFWKEHPAQDARASMILFRCNEGDAALARLKDRTERDEEVEKTYRYIEKEMRKRPRR